MKGVLCMGRTYCRIPRNDIKKGPSGEICCHFPVFPGFETRIY